MALKDKYFTISGTAKKIGVARQTVSRWIKEGQLNAERVGRETLIAVEEIDKITKKIPVDWFERNASLVDWIKAEYGYSDDDTVERSKDDTFAYIITRKDGTREKVEVTEFDVRADRYDRKLFTVTPSKAIREKLTKGKGRKGESLI